MSDPVKHALFGHPLYLSAKLTLAEQVHDILCNEIHNGRWDVNDRLPSISELAQESNLSRRPIQQAFEKLRLEGYIVQKRRLGTFLLSRMPQAMTHAGSIGVIVRETYETQSRNWLPQNRWRIHSLMREGTARGYRVDVYTLDASMPTDEQWEALRGQIAPDTRGMIGIQHARMLGTERLLTLQLPLVLWGSADHENSMVPNVMLDSFNASRLLTQSLIDAGHDRIIPAFCRDIPQYEVQQRTAGHYEAMRAAGLRADYDAILESVMIEPDDTAEFTRLLEKNASATAILCLSGLIPRTVHQAALNLGQRVPEDLSIVGFRTMPMDANDANRVFAGVDYDVAQVVNFCLDILIEQIEKRQTLISNLRYWPSINLGHSLGRPRDGVAASS